MTKTKNIAAIIITLICLLPQTGAAQIVPQPLSVEWKEGVCSLPAHTLISYDAKELKDAAAYLASCLPGSKIKHRATPDKTNIHLRLGDGKTTGAYSLDISAAKIIITAGDYSGIVNGIATLRQLLPIAYAGGEAASGQAAAKTVRCVTIVDAPLYAWRGMHVDASRHFFSKEEMMRTLDVMALYKLNKLHWHLTDDEGWRVEIKHYPELTRRGAWRQLDHNDRACINKALTEGNADMMPETALMRIANGDTLYGGFYSRRDIRDIIGYAAQRAIDIVPEIDMPGHSLAAIRCYPWLTCFEPKKNEVFTTPLCLGNDSVTMFCKNVWSEIISLFPGEYCHIGGDEVDMRGWMRCPRCVERMRKEHLNDGHAMQAAFTRDMEQFFTAHGKKMIGWDEILEGGVSKQAIIMWWRGWAPKEAMQAINDGHDAVCCPTSNFYLNDPQKDTDMEGIYNYTLPEDLNNSAKKHVMGFQGCLWAENIPSWRQQMYMAFPRMLAVAELAWTVPERKDFQSFRQRVTEQLKRLDAMGVNHSQPSH